ncbi:chemotaxis protein CheA [bacterium]|nr:chemotaxis protein CheA [bacterium]
MSTLAAITEEALLLSPGDGTGKKVASMLEDYASKANLSGELAEAAKSAVKLAKKVAGAKSSAVDLDKLMKLLTTLQEGESTDQPSTIAADLIADYLASQPSLLEDFEELALGLEEKGEESLRALKRQVHTWKGEAGIVGFERLSKALHEIEDELAQAPESSYPAISDAMLLLKDALGRVFDTLARGGDPDIDFRVVLKAMKAEAAPEIDIVVPMLPLPPEPVTSVPVVTFADPQGPAPQPHMPASGLFEIPEGVDVDLVGEFQVESEEHFTNIEVALMNLEATPDDMESVNTAFRSFHTVKGVASFVGVGYITELAHKAENLLDRVRKGTLGLTPHYLDLIFESRDLLRKLVQELNAAIAKGSYAIPPNYESLIYRLEHPEEVAPTSSAPKVEPIGELLVEKGVTTPEAVRNALDQQAGGDARPIGEILVSEGVVKPAEVTQALKTQQTDAASAAAQSTGDATVKVNMSRLDNLINMVGELVIAQAMVNQDPDIMQSANRKLTQNVAQLSKITRSLQELALSMRMVSVKATFQKMARLVRDVARKADKVVEFEMQGEETELDRNMVEAIADPLVHMVRNAVDHGVEPADQRVQVGKSRAGSVRLSAAHEGGSVVITLQDDGRGLNRDKILAKAIEKGLVEAGSQLTDKEIFALIFLPGFSTADKVTDVSGRGVGMDVVRTNIEKLRGSVEIDSAVGQGSVFRIRLPLTLAIIDGMVLTVGSHRYILPTITITESLRPASEDIVTIHGRGELVKLRGELIPVCRLHSMFGISGAKEELPDSILLVAEAKSGRVAIMADGLLGQQQVVIKSLGKQFDGIEAVAGCAILGDGRISLILDVEGIQAMCRS